MDDDDAGAALLLLSAGVGLWPHQAFVEEALLQRQYFPNVKEDGEELPPVFGSSTYTRAVADGLAALNGRKHAGWVEFRTRRFDGLVRRLGIPHPVPYARLIIHITNNWSTLAPLLDGEVSQIRPSGHKDGRLVQMNYDGPRERALDRDIRAAHGAEFQVKADISNCFPSVYSHALDWAVRGKSAAKQWAAIRGRRPASWEADLDALVRNCHDQETKGIMIGPAVSNLLSELILQRVDEGLVKQGHRFVRYIDDYTAHFAGRREAEQFVVDLHRALAEYRMDLNTRKTRIIDLRSGVSEIWMSETLTLLPQTWSAVNAVRYLQHLEVLARRHPHASVLKYGVKSLLGRRKSEDAPPTITVIDELLRLNAFHPHLMPFLAAEIGALGKAISKADRQRLAVELTRQLIEAGRRCETDVVLWALYILRVHLKQRLTKPVWSPLLDMADDLVFVALAAMWPSSSAEITKRIKNIDYILESDYERHWLSRYEFFRVGLLAAADLGPSEKAWMTRLQTHGVAFSTLTCP